MTKPTPEQFGLTTETVKSLKEERARRDKRRETLWLLSCTGLGIIGAIALYVSKNPQGEWHNSILNLIGFLMNAAVFAIIGCAAGLILSRAFNSLLPDQVRYLPLTRYLEAIAQYEAWFIRTQSAFWESLSGREFEVEVSNLFNRAGFHARLTPASGDGGVDIVLGDGTIVQCKAHRAPASPGVVRELYGALTHQNAPKAMLISLGGVTDGVRSFIKGKPIIVWDKTNLIALQKTLDK